MSRFLSFYENCWLVFEWNKKNKKFWSKSTRFTVHLFACSFNLHGLENPFPQTSQVFLSPNFFRCLYLTCSSFLYLQANFSLQSAQLNFSFSGSWVEIVWYLHLVACAKTFPQYLHVLFNLFSSFAFLSDSIFFFLFFQLPNFPRGKRFAFFWQLSLNLTFLWHIFWFRGLETKKKQMERCSIIILLT